MSITQLSQQFSEQRLHQDASLYVRSEPCENSYNDSIAPPTWPLGKSYIGSTPSKRREQRQNGVRMLCDGLHLRNIQEMVEKMVRAEDQCVVVAPPQTMSVGDDGLPDPQDDEGYSSLEDNTAAARQGSASSSSSCDVDVQYKRSWDLSRTGASVSKSVKVRKARSRRMGQVVA